MNLNQINTLTSPKRKRLGRGHGSGTGTTAGRGTKGQKSRSGSKIPARFQGGSLPLWQRLPKKNGLKSRREKPIIISLNSLEKHYQDGEKIDLDSLEKKGLISVKDVDRYGIKILANGKISKKVTLDKSLKASSAVRALFGEK